MPGKNFLSQITSSSCWMMMVVAKIMLDDSDGRYVMLTFVLASGNLNNTTCFILNSITEVKISSITQDSCELFIPG